MSTQPLTSTSAPLQFTDSASCKRWIEQLTLTNVQLTQQALTGQLTSLGAAPHRPARAPEDPRSAARAGAFRAGRIVQALRRQAAAARGRRDSRMEQRHRPVAGNEPQLPAMPQGLPRRRSRDRAARGAHHHALPAPARLHPARLLPHLSPAAGRVVARAARDVFVRRESRLRAHPRPGQLRAARSGLELRGKLRPGAACPPRQPVRAVGAANGVRFALARALGEPHRARHATAADQRDSLARRRPHQHRQRDGRGGRGAPAAPSLPRSRAIVENAAPDHQPAQAGAVAGAAGARARTRGSPAARTC